MVKSEIDKKTVGIVLIVIGLLVLFGGIGSTMMSTVSFSGMGMNASVGGLSQTTATTLFVGIALIIAGVVLMKK